MTDNEKRIELIKSIENNLGCYDNKKPFLVLNDKEFSSLQSKKILEKNVKCSSNYYGYWLKDVNKSNWCLKISTKNGIPNEFFLEILSEKLAKDLGIQTVESTIVEYKKESNKYGILSSDYRRADYNIINGEEIIYEYLDDLDNNGKLYSLFGTNNYDEIFKNYYINSLGIIFEALRNHFTKTIKNNSTASSITEIIYTELIKRYIFCYLTLQKDFHLKNWEIAENNYGAYLVPMYDMELSFNNNFYDNKNASIKFSMSHNIDYDSDFKLFCKNEKNLRMVERMHNILNIENIMSHIKNINNMPNNLKLDIIKTFNEHYLKIDEMIDELKYKKSI